MIKTIALLAMAAGAVLIGLAVFLFFRLNAYSVYKELKSTERVHIDASIDEVARSMYYENQVSEPRKEEKIKVRSKLGFKKEKEKATIAKDDTSILYAESREEKIPPPVFKKEADVVKAKDNTDILKENESHKEVQGLKKTAKTGTAILKTNEETNDLDRAKKDEIVPSFRGTEPLQHGPDLEALNEVSRLVEEKLGTMPLNTPKEPSYRGTEPLEADFQKAQGTQPLELEEEPVSIPNNPSDTQPLEVYESTKDPGTAPLSSQKEPFGYEEVPVETIKEDIKEPPKEETRGTMPLGSEEESEPFKYEKPHEEKMFFIEDPDDEKLAEDRKVPIAEEPEEETKGNNNKDFSDTEGDFVFENYPEEFFEKKDTIEEFLERIPKELRI